MSATLPPQTTAVSAAAPRFRRSANPAVSVIAQGEPLCWLMGGALALCVIMVVALLSLVVFFGASTFWPLPVSRFELQQQQSQADSASTVFMGEVVEATSLAEAELSAEIPGESHTVAPGNGATTEALTASVSETSSAGEGRGLGPRGWWTTCLILAALTATISVSWFLADPRAAGRLGAGCAALLSFGLIAWGGYEVSKTAGHEQGERYKVRTGNSELTGTHYTWILGPDVVRESQPPWALVLERMEYGRFYGFPSAFVIDGKSVATEPAIVWEQFEQHHAPVRSRVRQIKRLVQHDIGEVNAEQEQARLMLVERRLEVDDAVAELREIELKLREAKRSESGMKNRVDVLDARRAVVEALRLEKEQAAASAERVLETVVESTRLKTDQILAQVDSLRQENARYALQLTTAQNQETTLTLDQIVRAYPANQLSFWGKLGVYLSRWSEFISDDPREANSEGGVFPAIVGTVVMTLIMAIAVVPFGVLAALYLKEYARGGWIVSVVRIAINNLAGVPSIVFGVFGLGFFCYIIGAFVDGGPERIHVTPLPSASWWLGMLGLVGFGTGAFLLGIFAAAQQKMRRSARFLSALRGLAFLLWIAATITFFVLVFTNPYFQGAYRARLPNPTFGTGGVLWASLTLALLTLPVVIVSTEEALASVPNSMREGSYACGASKWQTIRRIVLPRAMPGIMTGTILAMARGAGEVAPLMLVGAGKLASELPVDGQFPFIHGSRTFMHLGFHIYDVGFQSQNSEAARPLVFTTTLLLILIIALLNIVAIWLRGRLQKKFVSAAF